MYNNFSSKKTKKVISALLASALVVTSGPITADAATAKVVGIKKSITVSASATNKVTGLSKAEKNIVKVTKKGKKFTIKGLKAGKATFKIGKKSYTVKVGATTVKAAKTKLTLTKGKSATLKFTTKSGNGDTLTFKASNKNVTLAKKSAKIAKSAASVKATAKKAGKTTITATSKATGKKATVTVTVKNAAKPATTTPGASNTPVATATGSATNTPEATATATATATASGSATNTPDVTATPVATATATPVATGSATNTPEATEVPTEAPTKAPEVVTGGTITVTGAAVSGASVTIVNASGAAVYVGTAGVATKTLPAGTYTITVKKDGYDTKTETVELADKEAKVVSVALEESLKVASVKTVGLGEVVVTFNKALTDAQASAAKKTTNYKIYKDGSTTDLTKETAVVSDDKKSVTILLTYADRFVQNKNANKVVVSKAIGLSADYTAENLTSSDIAIPQLVKAEAVGNKTVTLTFSEPLNLANAAVSPYTITDANKYFGVYAKDTAATSYTVDTMLDSATISPDKKVVTITLDKAYAVGTYDVVIYGASTTNNLGTDKSLAVTDYADYVVPSVTKQVNIVESSKVAQATTVKVVDRKTINVTFDSAVTPTGTLTWKTATVTKNSTGVKAVNNTTLQYTFADTIPTGTIDVTVANVVDAYGYNVPAKTFEAVSVVASSVATATVKVESDDEIDVFFSQAMQCGTASNSITTGDASNKANYVIKNAKGETVDLSDVTATYSSDATKGEYKVVLTKTDWNLEAGVYTITVSGVNDTYGDAMTPLTNEAITVTDTTQPGVLNSTVYGAAASRKISITFTEAMAVSGDNSITNAKNYQYKPNGGSYGDLPTGTTLSASADGKLVIITLPSTATLTAGSDEIQIGKAATTGVQTVADASGNTFKALPGTVGAQFTITPDASVSLTGATKVKDATTLRLAVSGTLASVDANDFYYTVNGGKSYEQAKSATLVVDNGTQYVDVEMRDALTVNSVRANVYVKTVVANGETALKSVTALGTPLTMLTVSNEIDNDIAAWPFRASLKSAEVLNEKQIRLVFDGNVKAETTKLPKFIKITNGTNAMTQVADGSTNKIASITQDGSNAVIITYATGTEASDKGAAVFDTTKTTTVSTVLYSTLGATSNWAVDANDVYFVENTKGITAENSTALRAQSIAISNLVANTNAVQNTTAIKLTFNQPVKASTIGTVLSSDTTDTDYNYTIDTAGKLTLKKGTTTANLGTISGFTATTSTAGTAALTASGNDLVVTLTSVDSGSAKVDGKIKYVPSASLTDELNNKIDASVSVETAGDYVAPKNDGNATVTAAETNLAVNDTIKVKFTEAINITNLKLNNIKPDSKTDYEFKVEKDTTDNTGKTVIITCTKKGEDDVEVASKSIVIPKELFVDADGQNPATDLTIVLTSGVIS